MTHVDTFGLTNIGNIAFFLRFLIGMFSSAIILIAIIHISVLLRKFSKGLFKTFLQWLLFSFLQLTLLLFVIAFTRLYHIQEPVHALNVFTYVLSLGAAGSIGYAVYILKRMGSSYGFEE
jgi:hypothetical protein